MATKLTVKAAPTPTQEVLDDANRVYPVTDARGRVIGIRKITMNIRRRVFKALSADAAQKPQYLGLAMVAACVTEIDGEPVTLPTNELQFDALIDRLDDDGVHLLGDQVLDVGDLLLLVEAGIEQDEFADALVLGGGSLGLMRDLHRPGVGVDAEMAHADDPGRILLELPCLDRWVVAGAGGNPVEQRYVVGERGRAPHRGRDHCRCD